MKEYIKHNRPSTTPSTLVDTDSYIAQWGKNVTDWLSREAGDVSVQAGALLGRPCMLAKKSEVRTAVSDIGPSGKKAIITYKMPFLSIDGTHLCLDLDWFLDLCAPLPAEISGHIVPETVFAPGTIDMEEAIAASLQEYFNARAEKLFFVLNDGITGKIGKEWTRNGRPDKKVKTWVRIGTSISVMEVSIKASRFRPKKAGARSFSYRCGLFSPYSPFMIPQVLYVVSWILENEGRERR